MAPSIQYTSPLRPLQRPMWLPESVWPFDTAEMMVDGRSVAVTDIGEGRPLLFVHTGLWSFVWRDVLLRLSRDHRCICFDAPGTGRSARPNGAITIAGAARATQGVLEQLDLRNVTIVVHDLGGIAGLAAAARVSARIDGIVAINAFAWRPSGLLFRSALRLFGSTAMREVDALTGIIPAVTATSFGIGRHLDRASRAAFREGLDRHRVRAFHRYLEDSLRCDSTYAEIDAAFHAALGRLPLMTIFGEKNDPLHFQPEWRARFPHADQIVVRGGHHFPMCDDPDLVADNIRRFRASARRGS